MRQTRAYCIFCSKAVLVFLHPIRRNSLFCSSKSQKITKNLYFWSLRSFKVIDVNTTKTHGISACYNKQHVCAYQQPF